MGRCGAGDDAPSSAVLRRDSAGIEIIDSRAPAWSSDEGWRLSGRFVLQPGENPAAFVDRSSGA